MVFQSRMHGHTAHINHCRPSPTPYPLIGGATGFVEQQNKNVLLPGSSKFHCDHSCVPHASVLAEASVILCTLQLGVNPIELVVVPRQKKLKIPFVSHVRTYHNGE